MTLLLRPMFGHLTCSSEAWQHLSPAHVIQLHSISLQLGTTWMDTLCCRGRWRTSPQEWDHSLHSFPLPTPELQVCSWPSLTTSGNYTCEMIFQILKPMVHITTRHWWHNQIYEVSWVMQCWQNADPTYFSLNILTLVTLVTKGFAVQDQSANKC